MFKNIMGYHVQSRGMGRFSTDSWSGELLPSLTVMHSIRFETLGRQVQRIFKAECAIHQGTLASFKTFSDMADADLQVLKPKI
jgi:hypothetical protein